MRLIWLVVMLLASAIAHAEPTRLRMAAVAPEGTAWARELHALARDIDTETHGQVQMKWYLGGIAGDELAVLDRIKKGQLDGTAGAFFCDRLAPSFRVNRVVALFQTRDESTHVIGALRNQFTQEFTKSGFVPLTTGNFGNSMLFTRTPVRSLADLKRVKIWIYQLDDILVRTFRGMGAQVVAGSVEDAAKAYDEGRIDGFLTTPTVGLAFQWTSRVKYFTDLTVSMLPGCMVVTQRAFDALSTEHQRTIRAAAAKFGVRFDEVGVLTEKQLLGGLFEKQGLTRLTVDATVRGEFWDQARRAREQIADLVDPDLVARVLSLLAEFRALRAATTSAQ